MNEITDAGKCVALFNAHVDAAMQDVDAVRHVEAERILDFTFDETKASVDIKKVSPNNGKPDMTVSMARNELFCSYRFDYDELVKIRNTLNEVFDEYERDRDYDGLRTCGTATVEAPREQREAQELRRGETLLPSGPECADNAAEAAGEDVEEREA